MQPFNKYYPPDWTPEKGSVNKFVGKHPLGDRARKLDQGILIVRFELPFNIWCEGCDSHVGKGVRYNAEKKQIGKYYSTTIWQFRMKCHLCSQWIEIHTDPKNTEYVVVSGARRKMEQWTPDKDDGVVQFDDVSLKERLEEDPLFRLEHGVLDATVGSAKAPVLTQLQQLNDSQWKDPYTQSQRLRRRFRDDKKQRQKLQADADRLKDKHSLDIDILHATEQDTHLAQLVDFDGDKRALIDQKKRAVASASLFSSDTAPSSSSLKDRARLNTKLKMDPFWQGPGIKKRAAAGANTAPLANLIVKRPRPDSKASQDTPTTPTTSTTKVKGASLVSYSDDDESDS